MISPIQELKESRDRLISSFSESKCSETFQDDMNEVMDTYFRRGLQESETGTSLFRKNTPFALVAVGGYGRKELSLHSDIDIMILFGQKIPSQAKKLAQELLFPLWDLHFDLGYAIRSIKDCLALSKDDFEVLTSMLDARFVGGDSPLYLSLMERLQKKVISKKATALGRWLREQDKIRMATCGDASHLLEPNLKEGIGGLRDYHHILWLAKVFFGLRVPKDLEYMGKFSYAEYQDLRRNLRFISMARNHLHLLSARKYDRLVFEFQETIAERLGFRNKKDFPGVEQFMGELHASMASLKSLHRSFVSGHLPNRHDRKKSVLPSNVPEGLVVHQDELNFISPTAILSNPMLLFEIFEQSARTGFTLSLEAKRLVREFLYLVDDDYRKSQAAVRHFLYVINHPDYSETLDQIFETGLLGTWIPEFEQIRDRVQFDMYHIFPVGRHLLETFKNLKSIPRRKEILLSTIFSDLENREPLFLAGLFHDVGKIGRNHARRGVAITRHILTRFGYEKALTEDVLFLVGAHLLLVETATRRDLNDEKVIVQCARAVGSIDRLKMLYLLTWADSNATGPRAWNEWIASLVQELFFKILHTLEKGELATRDASRKVQRTLSRVRRETADLMAPEHLEGLLEALPPHYLLETTPQEIVRHLMIFQDLSKQSEDPADANFFLEAVEEDSEICWKVTFMAKDRPGLFSDFAGVMALNNINILSAHIYTWRDGTALDIFRVTRPLDPLHSDAIWNKVKTDLKHRFDGNLDLVSRLKDKAKPSILSRNKNSARPPNIVVDNETSDFFSVIEVFADDRVGLLYLITRALFDLGLDIRIAKIATKGDQIADVFYVHDFEGQKVENQEQVEDIKKTLFCQLQ